MKIESQNATESLKIQNSPDILQSIFLWRRVIQTVSLFADILIW